jgi:hypothetical protein
MNGRAYVYYMQNIDFTSTKLTECLSHIVSMIRLLNQSRIKNVYVVMLFTLFFTEVNFAFINSLTWHRGEVARVCFLASENVPVE